MSGGVGDRGHWAEVLYVFGDGSRSIGFSGKWTSQQSSATSVSRSPSSIGFSTVSGGPSPDPCHNFPRKSRSLSRFALSFAHSTPRPSALGNNS